jgi:hypothetical protein
MRLLPVVLRIVAVAITALHGVLLWQRVEDLSITRPDVMARWCAAAIVAATGLLLVRRRVITPRGWFIFWLVVALLHAAAPGIRSAALIETALAFIPLVLVVVAIRSARPLLDALAIDSVLVPLGCGAPAALHGGRAPPRQ